MHARLIVMFVKTEYLVSNQHVFQDALNVLLRILLDAQNALLEHIKVIQLVLVALSTALNAQHQGVLRGRH